MHDKRLFFYLIAIILGVLTGTVGSLFQLAILGTASLLDKLYAIAQQHHISVGFVSAIVSMFMVFIASVLVKRYAAEAGGSGVQEIEGTLLHERPIYWRRLLPIKFIGGVFAIASKMVLGREGPTIQMGGNLGDMLGEWFHFPQNRRDVLIAAGAAAGLATAFNAPLAGVLFVIEEMRNEFNFSFTNFKAVAICCVFATIMLHLIMGSSPAIPMNIFKMPGLESLWLFFVFGIVVGFAGLIFNTVLMKTLYRLDKSRAWVLHFYVLLVGAMVGYLAYVYPHSVGGGYTIIHDALTLQPTLSVLIGLIAVRFFTTIVCYSTGVPGGIFAPMLALGTLMGLAFSNVLTLLSIHTPIAPGMFAVAGMGALFAAAVRAPLTGIILVVEMTQNYYLILPLMVTCLTSTTIVQHFNNPPIYEQLLQRTLKRVTQRS